MPKITDQLSPDQISFIEKQRLFFVATAPADGRVNVSPKGLDSFRCITPTRVAYLDLTGSGNETAAHVNENRRITVMFCAFSGAPKILRIYGEGSIARPGSATWQELAPLFPPLAGARQFIDVQVTGVQSSCGFGVPRFEPSSERDELIEWSKKKGGTGVREYQRKNNQVSIDGRDVYPDLPDTAP